MPKVRHVLGISGGKDSSALAIYLRDNYPELDGRILFCDTGKELDETYEFIGNLKVYLGKSIQEIRAVEKGQVETDLEQQLKTILLTSKDKTVNIAALTAVLQKELEMNQIKDIA